VLEQVALDIGYTEFSFIERKQKANVVEEVEDREVDADIFCFRI